MLRRGEGDMQTEEKKGGDWNPRVEHRWCDVVCVRSERKKMIWKIDVLFFFWWVEITSLPFFLFFPRESLHSCRLFFYIVFVSFIWLDSSAMQHCKSAAQTWFLLKEETLYLTLRKKRTEQRWGIERAQRKEKRVSRCYSEIGGRGNKKKKTCNEKEKRNSNSNAELKKTTRSRKKK